MMIVVMYVNSDNGIWEDKNDYHDVHDDDDYDDDNDDDDDDDLDYDDNYDGGELDTYSFFFFRKPKLFRPYTTTPSLTIETPKLMVNSIFFSDFKPPSMF